jgi:hypothetical protein
LTGHVACMEVNRGAYRILVVNSEGKSVLEKPRRILENNIKIDLKEIRCASMNWINLARNSDQWQALVNTLMNLRFP